MAAGMIVALLWHGWQGWVLNQGYPYNTFLLSMPGHQFDDLTNNIKYSQETSVYNEISSLYFPGAYVFFWCFRDLTSAEAIGLYTGVCLVGFWALLTWAIHPLVMGARATRASVAGALAWAAGFLALSYPLLITVDRGNLELLNGLCVALALVCFQRRWFLWGLLCLVPPMAFKFFPGLLLLLFLRPSGLVKIFLTALLAVLANVAAVALMQTSFREDLALWRRNMASMDTLYVHKDLGLYGTASLWNTLKTLNESFIYFTAGAPRDTVVVLATGYREGLYEIYWISFLLLELTVIFCVVLVEREFFRRVILLLVLLSLWVPSGADYRLIYANIALVCWILLPTRRRLDLLTVGLLAFAMVPKREGVLLYTGICDTTISQTTIGVLLTPPALLGVLLLMLWSAWRQGGSRFGWQRLKRLFAGFWGLIWVEGR